MIAAELRGGNKPSLNEALGWIGSRVDDIYGASVGRLEDVWIDPGTGVPRWLLVKEGRFGGRSTLVPFGDATAGAGHVWVPYERDVVREAPQIKPGVPLTQQVEATLRNHYAANAAAAVGHGSQPSTHAGSDRQEPRATVRLAAAESIPSDPPSSGPEPTLPPPRLPQRPAPPVQPPPPQAPRYEEPRYEEPARSGPAATPGPTSAAALLPAARRTAAAAIPAAAGPPVSATAGTAIPAAAAAISAAAGSPVPAAARPAGGLRRDPRRQPDRDRARGQSDDQRRAAPGSDHAAPRRLPAARLTLPDRPPPRGWGARRRSKPRPRSVDPGRRGRPRGGRNGSDDRRRSDPRSATGCGRTSRTGPEPDRRRPFRRSTSAPGW